MNIAWAQARLRLAGDPVRVVVAVVSAITVLTGAVQLMMPGVVLDVMGADSTATSRFLFAVVGMFMTVVGGLTVHAALSAPVPEPALLWSGLQKLGAFVAVGVGVITDLFTSLAMLVSLFDLTCALFIGLLWHQVRNDVRSQVIPA